MIGATRRIWSMGAVLAVALLCTPVFATQAEEIDAAKHAGLVGEQSDGYLGLVRAGAPADVKGLVDEVNGKRRAAYAEIAAKNGTPVEAVARLAGVKLVERAAPGEYVRDDTGEWKQK
jgi:uncharacterized protein YdbL (DUF1318 family)